MEADKDAATDEGNEAAELFNRQVDQQKLSAMAARVAQLQDEDAELRARHDKREQETHEFVAYFQKEIQTRDKQLTKLGEELAAARLSHALALEQMQQARDADRQHLMQQTTAKEEAASEQIFYLLDAGERAVTGDDRRTRTQVPRGESSFTEGAREED
ncbi:hypothetical protein PRIC1_003522 [Phytophthora ramorum]